jgi:selenocysteine lyase/cysteine desulfurase
VELLIDCLGLRYLTKGKDDDPSRPIVFVGPQEHHSNLIPWRESGCQVVCIPESSDDGGVDLVALQMQLQRYQSRECVKMGTFAAASNVNGRISDVDAIATLLHSYGALAFFDYATAAPYMPIDMNPLSSTTSTLSAAASSASKDAVFISPHKMLGGVSTPGVLIVKKHLVDRRGPPNRSGGGTVFYVTPTHHRFLSNRVERYEGGTPNIMGVARVGLAFLAKRSIESRVRTILTTNNSDAATSNTHTTTVCKSLLDLECRTYRHSVDRLKKSAPNLLVLGEGSVGGAGDSEKAQHLPILSFLIKAGERFLHYNYVCAVLNDVFGIQSRGGCQCAGPYSQRLLGLTTTTVEGEEVPNVFNQRIEHALVHSKERAELLRPGYSRLSLPFKGLCQEEVDYILTALEWVAKHAWALMAQYRCNHRTGEVRT